MTGDANHGQNRLQAPTQPLRQLFCVSNKQEAATTTCIHKQASFFLPDIQLLFKKSVISKLDKRERRK